MSSNEQIDDKETLSAFINNLHALQQDLIILWATDNDRRANLSTFIRRLEVITQNCLQNEIFSASIIENIWEAREELRKLATQYNEGFFNERRYIIGTVRGRGRPAYLITAEQLAFFRGICR